MASITPPASGFNITLPLPPTTEISAVSPLMLKFLTVNIFEANVKLASSVKSPPVPANVTLVAVSDWSVTLVNVAAAGVISPITVSLILSAVRLPNVAVPVETIDVAFKLPTVRLGNVPTKVMLAVPTKVSSAVST